MIKKIISTIGLICFGATAFFLYFYFNNPYSSSIENQPKSVYPVSTLTHIIDTTEAISEFQQLKTIENSVDEYLKMKHARNELTINTILWLCAIILALLTFLSVLTGFYYFVISKAKFNDEVEKFNKAVNKIISDEIVKVEEDFENNLLIYRASFYYNTGVRFINEKEFESAYYFFSVLYKSKGYRFDDVCYHLGVCCYNLGRKNEAIDFFNEAKKQSTDSSKIYAIEKTLIEYELT
jgi:tetratricopeptide (TPR) repeat protein